MIKYYVPLSIKICNLGIIWSNLGQLTPAAEVPFNKILLFSRWRQKATHPILRYSSVLNMEKGSFANFKNSYKINENNYNDNLFAEVIWRKKNYIRKKNLGGHLAL